ncbi:NADH-cytochrome b5 reductase [Dissophora globulifera]|uniref:NADH-cytochrome b5 reductase n=1 Tax=Dissophora globulifera TaxID=979702 RepID=A0A9P6RK19_9FUNG|nr:NADH-cytochrome b5 reductase [Dissophora globulifera]
MAATALNPEAFVDFKLKSIHALTPNTSKFVFELPEHQTLGMTVASCVVTKFINDEGKPVIRPYTPTSNDDVKGSFDFIIKRYDAGVMSAHIHSLKVGDTLAVKGPMSKYPLQLNQHKNVVMIAGGTGITPMLQLVNGIFNSKGEDTTQVHLVYANVSSQDIIFKDELDELVKKHPGQFKLTYVIDRAEDGWNGEVGYITADLIKKHIPGVQTEVEKVFVCGPPPMMVAVSGGKGPNFTQGEVEGTLKELGFTSDKVFKF